MECARRMEEERSMYRGELKQLQQTIQVLRETAGIPGGEKN